MSGSSSRLRVFGAIIALTSFVGCKGPSSPQRPRVEHGASPSAKVEAASGAPAPRVVESVVENSGERFKYRFRASLFANLFYFVDCASGATHCAREAFEELAHTDLDGLSEEDRAALKTWKEVRSRYRGRITQADDPDDLPLPLPHSHRQVERRARLAGYTSTTPLEYEGKLAMFAEQPDAARATAVLERFLPRFERYWQKAEPALARIVDDYVARVRQPELRKLIDRVAGFYDADIQRGSELTFELILRPETPRTNAEQLATVSLVEVIAGERPEERLGVVFHELFHYLLSRVQTKRVAPLVDRFAKSDDRVAYAAYGLLDEALATTFGNGVIVRQLDPAGLDRQLARPYGLYTDDFIDKMAKTLLPEADGILDRGIKVYDTAFYDTYLEAAHRAFADGLPPRAVLRPFVAAYSPELDASIETLYDVANTAQSASSASVDPAISRSMFDERPSWTRVLMMKRADIAAIAGWKTILSPSTLAEVPAVARKHASFAYADLPKGKPALFLFVADTNAELTKLVRRFGDLPSLRAGVLID